LKEEEIPGELLEGVKQMIVGFKKVREHISSSDREAVEEGLISLIADIIHSWMKSKNIDPDQAAIRIEIEEEEIEIELPKRISRFRL
jgi:membrane-bound ClpP family serine protease